MSDIKLMYVYIENLKKKNWLFKFIAFVICKCLRVLFFGYLKKVSAYVSAITSVYFGGKYAFLFDELKKSNEQIHFNLNVHFCY